MVGHRAIRLPNGTSTKRATRTSSSKGVVSYIKCTTRIIAVTLAASVSTLLLWPYSINLRIILIMEVAYFARFVV